MPRDKDKCFSRNYKIKTQTMFVLESLNIVFLSTMYKQVIELYKVYTDLQIIKHPAGIDETIKKI